MSSEFIETTTSNYTIDVTGPRNRVLFDAADISAVAIYFVLLILTAFGSMWVSDRHTVSGYFLAGRFMTWLPIGASLFASNIGSEHFIGLAGSGAAFGIGVGAFEINAMAIVQLTGWVFLPVFIASRVCTLPEYMAKRFGGNRIRSYLAVLSLVLYIFTKISVNLFAGAIFVQQAFRWDLYSAICVLLALTAVCTVTGGLVAVMYTDTLQCVVMLVGASFVCARSFYLVGGYNGLREKYTMAVPSQLINGTECGIPNEETSWKMLRPIDDMNMPWLGFLVGQTPASIWYWCTDQMMVQRLLAAKSLSHAQGGALFAGFLKFLPLFLIVMPGMISRVLFPDDIGCVVPEVCEAYCGNKAGCSNTAYPRLVLEVMPTGFRGLLIAVMLAALISDLTSIYNSASTLFTMDIWPQIRKKASTWELMVVGRTFVIFMVLVSIAWIPVIQNMQGGQLFIYIQSVSAYLAPPIAAVYLMAVLWKRLNEQGTFWALMLGFVVGCVRMIMDFSYPEPSCGEIDDRPFIIRKVHYMYFACFLFWITALSAVIISLMTKPPEPFRLIRATFWTRYQLGDRDDDKENIEMYRPTVKEDDAENDEEKNKEAQHLSDNAAIGPATTIVRPPKNVAIFIRPLKTCCDWYCGMNKKKQDENDNDMINHITEIGSLKQTKQEKVVLRTLLFITLCIPVVVFSYFSIDFPR